MAATDEINGEICAFLLEFSSAIPATPQQFSVLIVCYNDGGYYFRIRPGERASGRDVEINRKRERERERRG